MAKVFVFGSNLKGIHGAGAAKTAREKHGAKAGVGQGRTGNAYAIPTKAEPTHIKRQIPLDDIEDAVHEFVLYALEHPSDEFMVTAIGCGLAGYKPEEIAPMFLGSPANVEFLDIRFQDILERLEEVSGSEGE